MNVITTDQLKTIVCDSGLLERSQFEEVVELSHLHQRSVEDILIERSLITPEYLTELIADHLKISYVQLGQLTIEQELLLKLPEATSRNCQAIVYARPEEDYLVAMSNPVDPLLLTQVKEALGHTFTPFLASQRDITTALRGYQTGLYEQLQTMIASLSSRTDNDEPVIAASSPVVQVVDKILDYACYEDASDIHIEPLSDVTVVRFRIDGALTDIVELPIAMHHTVISRIKIMANLKIDEHFKPLDGRFAFTSAGQPFTTRVSTIPTYHGEKIVIRLLKKQGQFLSLSDLGLDTPQIELVQKAVKRPFGMILVVGPTGSGKTTSVYYLLRLLNRESANISTIEDPIELDIRRINQSQVNEPAGYTFANGLRALLRQDPDIIMVGEIRDQETSSIALRSALTGHLVLSTLHTNDSIGAIPRLLDMGAEPYLLSSTINLVISQRLVRRICPRCIESHVIDAPEARAFLEYIDPETLALALPEKEAAPGTNRSLEGLQVYRGKGCSFCHQTGYKGRIGIYEVLDISNDLRELISRRAATGLLRKAALSQGMQTMLQSGMEKVFAGLTTMEELFRASKE